MPYTTTDQLPAYVRAQLSGAKLRQWMHVWQSEYQRCTEGKAAGRNASDCESVAFASANAVAGIKPMKGKP